VARWNYYLTGGPDKIRAARITDSATISSTPADAQAVLQRDLTRMVLQFTALGRRVYIVDQVPEQFSFNTRTAFYRAAHTGESVAALPVTVKESDVYREGSVAVFDSLKMTPHLTTIDPAKILCAGGTTCPIEEDGTVLYRDSDHISSEGAMTLLPLFESLFKTMSSQK